MGEINNIRRTSRYTSLDGLRGLAALVVLVHHCCMVSPQLAEAAEGGEVGPAGSWVWWATVTPLHLMWAGSEAVFVFFILSGFVLTLPFVGNSQPSWAAYFSKRLVRIYLPVWASLVLALLAAWAFPRVAAPEFSSWVNMHDDAPNVLVDGFLLLGTGSLNTPLWSLQWEMVFSLLLPLYLFVAVRIGRAWLPSLVGLILLIAVGGMMAMAPPVFLSMFGIGVLMASKREMLEKWGRRLGRRAWATLLVASMVLLCSRWMLPQLPMGIAMATTGGALLIFAFIGSKSAITLGDNPTVQWLGTRSFSIYLVHDPIVVSVAFSMHGANAFHVAVTSVSLSLLTAEVFFRLVERSSLRLARLAGQAVTNGVRSNRVVISRP
ncbi:acyltransferase [Pseudarthrobacter sulfonivorans]|uniref:acyltransferase family protein n=1 Tax=Pseudarthrobacter sulfonivorans TaxID=121292 RepID=UPI00285F46FB|nr:acyltransferase [Pseudarthrobacter sulfonivorans]MDR6413631.1 peptidoglycan/LPS O-acetylase OafA/YrhL [Pseudarthrobacter sulfonivorans]